jgi:hypothetical protein
MHKQIRCKILVLFYFGGVVFLPAALSQSTSNSDKWIFQRVQEPNENAFSLLIPQGWKTTGGIYRIDPTAGGGSGNAIDAKVDFSVMSDESGEVMIRFLPDMNYFDMRYSPAGQMGLFPPGSNYNGMLVSPFQDAGNFIKNIVIPYIHPELGSYEEIDSRNSPELVEFTRKEDAYIGIPFTYDAGVVEVLYEENGVSFREAIIAVTQDFGQIGAGLWKNRHTFFVRAPKAHFEEYAPIFGEIINSLEINMNWLIGEIRGQVQRGETNAEVLRKLQQMDAEITQHQAQTNAQINNDMFLNLTGQEEYQNPYTNEIETGSNEWNYRWVNKDGEILYTDDIHFNPNTDQNLNRDDYKLSTSKK